MSSRSSSNRSDPCARPFGIECLEDRTLLTAGMLDPTFGAGGIVTTALPGDPTHGGGTGVAMQEDGKIVAVGFTRVGSEVGDLDSVVARYNSDGSLDASFGTGGLVKTDVGGFNGFTNDVAIDPNGKIVVVGGQEVVAVWRYDSDGSLDTTFSGDGVWWGANRSARAVAIQADGKIVVAHGFYVGGAGGTQGNFALSRINDDGSTDTTFGASGSSIADFGGDEGGGDVCVACLHALCV